MFRAIRRWFAVPAAASAKRPARRFQPTLEALDHRVLPAAGVRSALGRVLIEGTEQGDVVNVSIVDSQVVVDFNGAQSTFAAAGVRGITFRGRGGDDQFTNNTGIAADARGDAGNDTLRGGSGRDKLRGDDGNDHLFGEAGDDRLEGGRGADDLHGGDGRDDLLGGSEDDHLLGEAGDDRLTGDSGNDDVRGGSGDDTVSGGSGSDDLFGDDGRDSLSGGLGDDRLNGGAGDDRLRGDDGDDDLTGDAGDDRITGGRGRDRSERDGDDSLDDAEKGKGEPGGEPSVVTENESNDRKEVADRFALDATGRATLIGVSASKNDKDYFVFTATQSGQLRVDVAATNGVFAQVEIETAASVSVFETEPNDGINGGTFNVVAGTTYFVRLRAKDNLAAGYEVSFAMQA